MYFGLYKRFLTLAEQYLWERLLAASADAYYTCRWLTTPMFLQFDVRSRRNLTQG